MRPMPELEIHMLPVADLVPYAHNAKLHPEKQVEELTESIDDFGFCDPISVWHNEQGQAEIVEGHGRVLALQKMAEGFMLRYVYFIDRRWRKRLTVPEIPYSRIREVGAGMYKGVKR